MINLEEFYKTEYTVKFKNVLRQSWLNGETFNCLTKPKKEHLLLYFESGGATFKLQNGKKIIANKGDLAYIPAGNEYQVFFNGNDNLTSTIGVNFMLYDEKGNFILEQNNLLIFSNLSVGEILNKIEKLSYTAVQIPNKYTPLLYEIFNLLGGELTKENNSLTGFSLILPAIEYLNRNFAKEFDVSFLSKTCNVSEVYLRRLFKRFLGVSPIEYKQNLRLEKACHYLKYSDLSINEIANSLGYVDSAYFIKRFKKHFNLTPLSYRNSV